MQRVGKGDPSSDPREKCVCLYSQTDRFVIMDRIDVKKAQAICRNKGLKPGRLKGTKGVAFTKGDNPKFEVIGWDEFEKALEERGLAIYESGGYLKLMKA